MNFRKGCVGPLHRYNSCFLQQIPDTEYVLFNCCFFLVFFVNQTTVPQIILTTISTGTGPNET